MTISDAQTAMASWLGALARGGVLGDSWERAGEAVAAFVVGKPELDGLREWFAAQPPEVARRERRAAIEVCIWMAHADRTVDVEETHLLRQIIGASLLDEDTQDELVRASHEPPSLANVEKRLTHPVLRELLLALCWELASADGRVDDSERDFYTGLAKRLDIGAVRAAEIQRAISERVG
ncbi:MAG: TerB family tellurite resistance protein [Myxococcota bacterium]|nr:TerB family tellurite resistance protein [Myxococcota bacterium]